MSPTLESTPAVEFVSRWKNSGAAERANYQLFLSELCDVLGVFRPNPTVADDSQNSYVFERAVHFHNGDGTTSFGRIDLYKKDCFVLEAKQGSDQIALPAAAVRSRRGTAIRQTPGWDEAMLAARNQAERYAKAIPDGWPPFLITVDVGFSIELYADFSLTGKNYAQFPDRNTYRISIDELKSSEIRARLKTVWLDPLSLDPARISARVTRGVASRLAELAKDLEQDHPPEAVASFLMRCIFTSFAEDVHLLPADSWTKLLESLRTDVANFRPMVESLWQTMNNGGFSPIVREHVLRFNGGLFETVEAPLQLLSSNCSSTLQRPTGKTWNRPSSAHSLNAPWIRMNGTVWELTTLLVSMLSAWLYRRSSSRFETIGRQFRHRQ